MKLCSKCHQRLLPVPDKEQKSITRKIPYTKATRMGFLTGISSYYPTKDTEDTLCFDCKAVENYNRNKSNIHKSLFGNTSCEN